MRTSISVLVLTILAVSGCTSNNLKGTWQYDGGIYNGKSRRAATDFKMQRTYDGDSFEAFFLEENNEPRKYAAGNYTITNDSLYLTGTFSSQPSQLMGRTQVYQYTIAGNKLTIKGTLPNGMQVEEYWKRIN